MTWIQTYTGLQFWPLAPRIEDVCIEDIAWSLSLICRFNGHCRQFYSVAEHSIRLANELMKRGVCFNASPDFRANAYRAALLHDAPEAYVGDMMRPLKTDEQAYMEEVLLNCISEALGVVIDPEMWLVIKACDDALLATEARDLMGPPPAPWATLPAPLAEQIVPMQPNERVAVEFLARWQRAGGGEEEYDEQT